MRIRDGTAGYGDSRRIRDRPLVLRKAAMRICVILEVCYPYVTGGVSSWMHQYIQAMPEHEFVVWAINADPSQNGKFRYTLPENVVEVREVSANDNSYISNPKRKRLNCTCWIE